MKHIKLLSIILILFILAACETDTNLISDTYVDDDGHLIVVLQDGTEVDKGLIVEEDTTNYITNTYIDENGHLIVAFKDGTEADKGLIVEEDTTLYVKDTSINENGHLILVMSDDSIVDKGLVIEEDAIVHLVNFFNFNGHIISTQLIEDGNDAIPPTLEDNERYMLASWDTVYLDVTSDLNIYPIVTEKTFTISFQGENVTYSNIVDIAYGTMITLQSPSSTGKEFIGWFDSEDDYAMQYPTNIVVTEDLTLYAKYIDATYEVSYQTFGGTYIASEHVLHGETVAIPAEPVKPDFYFNGWYYDQECTIPVDFSLPITADVILFAGWIQFDYMYYNRPDYNQEDQIFITGVKGENKYIHIPDYIDNYPVEFIYPNAFNGNDAHYVYLPETLTKIGNFAFANMPNLTEIIIPETVTSIGASAFENDTALTSVVINGTFNLIRENTFKNTALTNITLPAGLEVIYPGAFANTNFTTFTIPEGVTYIGEKSFGDCMYLTSISLPSTLPSVKGSAFNGSYALSSILIDENSTYMTIVDDVIYNADMSTLHLYPHYKTDTTFTIPDSVTTIGFYAFTDNQYLETLNIPSNISLNSISTNFQNTTSLQALNVYIVAGGTNVISTSGVLYTPDFTKLLKYPQGKSDPLYTVNPSTVEIGSSAFIDANNLVVVELPEGLLLIHEFSFYNCTSLSSVNFPSTLIQIGTSAFENVDGIPSITISSNINFIGYNSFAEMDNLTTFIIEEGVTSIDGAMVISGSNNVTSIHIPASVSYINPGFLVGAKGVTTVTVEPTNPDFTNYYNCIYNKTLTELIVYPEGIPDKYAYIAHGTEIISADFGSNPNIEHIILLDTVTNFRANINDLPNLQTLRVHRYIIGDITKLEVNIDFDIDIIIIVPYSAYFEYYYDYMWGRYQDIIVY